MSRAKAFISSTPVEEIELELPSMRTVLIRRPPLAAWAVAGTIPPFFTADVRQAWDRVRDVDAPLADLDGEPLKDALAIIRALAEWAFVDPKLRPGAMGEGGAVDPSFLTGDDWGFLGDWFMKGSPGVPVPIRTEGREEPEAVSIEALHSFRAE